MDSDHLLVIAQIEQRMPILLDIEALMSSSGTGLDASPFQCPP
ncbi:hypothetical protein [Alicycliphilus denitrificans]